MERLLVLLIYLTTLVIVVGMPAWLVLLVIKIIRRNDPSQKISTAFKVVSIILLIAVPLLFLASLFYLPYALSSMPMTSM